MIRCLAASLPGRLPCHLSAVLARNLTRLHSQFDNLRLSVLLEVPAAYAPCSCYVPAIHRMKTQIPASSVGHRHRSDRRLQAPSWRSALPTALSEGNLQTAPENLIDGHGHQALQYSVRVPAPADSSSFAPFSTRGRPPTRPISGQQQKVNSHRLGDPGARSMHHVLTDEVRDGVMSNLRKSGRPKGSISHQYTPPELVTRSKTILIEHGRATVSERDPLMPNMFCSPLLVHEELTSS